MTALRTWARYAIPLTVLSAIAFAPQLIVALRTGAPADVPHAAYALRVGWTLIATAWPSHLLLVGAAAAIVRARPSQRRALTAGLGQLVRAIVPCALAIAAIALGGLALAVPGLILLVLLATTAASTPAPLPAPLLDGIAFVRPRFAVVAGVVVATLALDLAIGAIGQRVIAAPLPRTASPAQLAAAARFVRVVAIALVITAPLPATVLATLRERASS